MAAILNFCDPCSNKLVKDVKTELEHLFETKQVDLLTCGICSCEIPLKSELADQATDDQEHDQTGHDASESSVQTVEDGAREPCEEVPKCGESGDVHKELDNNNFSQALNNKVGDQTNSEAALVEKTSDVVPKEEPLSLNKRIDSDNEVFSDLDNPDPTDNEDEAHEPSEEAKCKMGHYEIIDVNISNFMSAATDSRTSKRTRRQPALMEKTSDDISKEMSLSLEVETDNEVALDSNIMSSATDSKTSKRTRRKAALVEKTSDDSIKEEPLSSAESEPDKEVASDSDFNPLLDATTDDESDAGSNYSDNMKPKQRQIKRSPRKKLKIENEIEQETGDNVITDQDHYTCDVCNKDFKSEKGLQEHRRRHDESKWKKCEVCGKVCITKRELQRHSISHSDERAFQCEHCPFRAKRKWDIRKHTLNLHGPDGHKNGQNKFECDVCGKDFKAKDRLREHRQRHDESKWKKCEVCDKVCITKRELQRHSLSHSEERAFQCEHCPFRGKRKWDIRKHTLNLHGPDRHKNGQNKFVCDVCGKDFKAKDRLREHRRRHDESTWKKCEVCGKVCITERELERHSISHSDERAFQCEHCPFRAKRKWDIRKHTLNLHELDGHEFACDICGKDFKGKDNLRNHRARHDKSKECCVCGKMFVNNAELQKHTRSHKPDGHKNGQNKFECDVCGKDFKFKDRLGEHRRRHDESTWKKCEVCDKVCITKRELQRHSLSHSEERAFQCKHCPFRAKRKWDIRKHTLNLHRPDGQEYACDICDKDFKSTDDLWMHRARHNESKECGVCGKMFAFNAEFINHIISHSEGGQKTFVCDICSKDFKSKHALQTHRARHDESKWSVCEVCGKVFITKRELERHSLTHSDEKLFQCEYCPYRAKHMWGLGKHIKRMHTEADPNKFTCKYCGLNFVNATVCTKHEQKHESGVEIPQKRHQCTECGYQAKKPCEIRRHHRQAHLKEKPFICEHEGCDKAYSTKACCQRHMETCKRR